MSILLQSIYVKNFILLDEVQLDFNQGMSAFIGETGAGKSLLMDAISVLKGERVQTSMIQQGKEQAIVEGVFTYEPNSITHQKLLEIDLADEEGQLILTRQWNVKGKSSARINHRNVSLSMLKEITEHLLDIHSQHDVISLLNPKKHLPLLDSYINDEELLKKVAHTWKTYQEALAALDDVQNNGYNEDDLDYLTEQFNEINDAKIQVNELEDLEQQIKAMQSFEKNQQNIQMAIEAVDGDDGVLNKLYDAIHALASVQDCIEERYHDELNDYYYNIEDLMTQLKDDLSNLEFDEEAFNAMHDRITLIRRLMRKYGGSEEALIHKKEQLEQAIDSIIHRSALMTKLSKQCNQCKEVFLKNAQELHEKRIEVAADLEQLVLKQLHDLSLEHANFKIQFQTHDGNAKGIDQVAFYISMNKGEALKPLQNTASGGELSRFMLGMKAVFAHHQGIETIIFDEIDTGVSGSVALRIGKKMQEIANHLQVFAVTHLAPVAACADELYYVEKTQDEVHTNTNIHLCDEEQTVCQLAMIAAGTTSEAAMNAASELRKKAKAKTL